MTDANFLLFSPHLEFATLKMQKLQLLHPPMKFLDQSSATTPDKVRNKEKSKVRLGLVRLGKVR